MREKHRRKSTGPGALKTKTKKPSTCNSNPCITSLYKKTPTGSTGAQCREAGEAGGGRGEGGRISEENLWILLISAVVSAANSLQRQENPVELLQLLDNPPLTHPPSYSPLHPPLWNQCLTEMLTNEQLHNFSAGGTSQKVPDYPQHSPRVVREIYFH